MDKSGNEDVQVNSVSATPMPMPGGTKDPVLTVEVYQPDKVWAGMTFLGPLRYDQGTRLLEVNMRGEIVWEYEVRQKGRMEAELLPNDHILYTVNPTGVFEIDRDGKVVWQYLTSKIDHDADRLPNGNTLITGTTAIVEVTPQSEIVWQLRMQGVTPEQISTGTAFYKAERIGAQQEE